jgi:hypothetical protein
MSSLFYVPIMCLFALVRTAMTFRRNEVASTVGSGRSRKNEDTSFSLSPLDHPQEGIHFF